MIGIIMMISVAIAQNWEKMSKKVKKPSGANIFAVLSQRKREEA